MEEGGWFPVVEQTLVAAERGRRRRGSTRPVAVAAADRVRVALRRGDGREIGIDEQLSIGSAEDNDLVLEDPYVSGLHCILRRYGQRVVVVDCGSHNGTFVGGVRVGTGELSPGMQLCVGRSAMRLVAEGVGEGLIGDSPAMRRLRARIDSVAPTRAAVLILGESGTGKELVARALHAASRRRGPFVVLNCGAISPELAESELFGHERGAFTGAAGRRPGVFEEATSGTLFLDEIGELPIALQPKLLRVLETGVVRAVGASGERRVDVRLVAATHRDLPAAVRCGAFRLDLYHRLAMVVLELPALRDRCEDLPLLARHFLKELAPEMGARDLSEAALDALGRYPWPGNVRELRNAIQRAAIFGGRLLEAEDLMPVAQPASVDSGRIAIDGRRLEEVEREMILRALRRTLGNRRAAAQSLGVPKSTLCDKVRRYQIDVPEEKR